MKSTAKKDQEEEPPPLRDVEARRKVIEDYIADLRAILEKLRRKLI